MASPLGLALLAVAASESMDAMRVAVLEHRVQKRAAAFETMSANLEIYDLQIQEAAQRGAKLLVTPEDGLTSFVGNQRALWWDYAASLPEPGQAEAQLPCIEASVWWPLRRLSCMALRHQVALVASLIDMKDCTEEPEFPGCDSSRDGWLLLNTAVVLDRDGRLLQKYHKANLWFEAALDESKECSPKTFSISGFEEVPFGIFICADLIHAWPPLELVTKGIRHFVMPLSWTNEMAQMQPLGWQQAWSHQMQAVLLAANTRSSSCSGSGIYVQGEAKAVAYDLEAQADQLLVTEVPLRLVEPAASPIGCPTSSDTRLLPVDEGSKWKSFQLDMTPGDHSSTLCSAATCCHVSYRSRRQGEGYVLAVLNGLDISPEVAPWAAEACAVLPCQSSSDCLTYPSEALRQHSAKWFGEFESLEMEANFSTTQEVFPQVLATSQRLLSPRAWHLHRGARSGAETTLRLALNGSAVEELVSLQLYGRPYSRDSDIQQHCHCGPKVEGVLV